MESVFMFLEQTKKSFCSNNKKLDSKTMSETRTVLLK